ncbi:MAG: hypothetical protein ACM3JH_13765 [Acidithiobacillales bacterium]
MKRRTTAAPAALLRELEAMRPEYGPGMARKKRSLLAPLARLSLGSAKEVERLHEALCFLEAFPDGAPLLADVRRLLAGFGRRTDLRRFRRELADTGIAGTDTFYPFYYPTALWLAQRWGDRLRIDWKNFERAKALEDLLPLLSHYAETPGLDEVELGPKGWLDRLGGSRETDAVYLLRRVAALPLDGFWKEYLYESLAPPLRLSPGPDTPSRTRARLPGFAVVFQRRPLSRTRPDVRDESDRPPLSLRTVSAGSARRLIDAARTSMVTRQRDLDVFEHASVRDVRLADSGDGLKFAVYGMIPERRLLLEAVYAYLTIRNGVPVGYVLVSALFGSSEIAFNVFESFRGAEAALVYGRTLGLTRSLFGSDSFTIFPYQLGDDNEEGIESGAWWFYRKLGFFPKAKEAIALMRREEARLKREKRRTTPAMLRRLAKHNLYFHLGAQREDIIGLVQLPNVGLKVTDALARRFGSDRERGARETLREAQALLGVPSLGRFSPGERLAFARWAPLVTLLPGLSRWSEQARRSLTDVIRAKGGTRESDFVRLFDAHRPLRRALLDLARD